jgi:chemotaxis protein CheY-P-specific phosphatase CheC
VTDPEIDIATTAIETIEEENLTEMIDATTVAVLVQRIAETATD